MVNRPKILLKETMERNTIIMVVKTSPIRMRIPTVEIPVIIVVMIQEKETK